MSVTTKPEKLLADLVTADNRIYSKVVRHAQLLSKLNQDVQMMLPTHLQGHCSVANWQDDCLVLHANGSAWAARLRYEQIELLKQLRDAIPVLASLKKLKVYNVSTA